MNDQAWRHQIKSDWREKLIKVLSVEHLSFRRHWLAKAPPPAPRLVAPCLMIGNHVYASCFHVSSKFVYTGMADRGVGTSPPQYFQICKKAGQKSAMLQESWPKYFLRLLFFFNDSWSIGHKHPPSNRRYLGTSLGLYHDHKWMEIQKVCQ